MFLSKLLELRLFQQGAEVVVVEKTAGVIVLMAQAEPDGLDRRLDLAGGRLDQRQQERILLLLVISLRHGAGLVDAVQAQQATDELVVPPPR